MPSAAWRSVGCWVVWRRRRRVGLVGGRVLDRVALVPAPWPRGLWGVGLRDAGARCWRAIGGHGPSRRRSGHGSGAFPATLHWSCLTRVAGLRTCRTADSPQTPPPPPRAGLCLKGGGGAPPPPPRLLLQLDPKARPQPQCHPHPVPTASDCPPTDFTVRPNRFVTALSLPPERPPLQANPCPRARDRSRVCGGAPARATGGAGAARPATRCMEGPAPRARGEGAEDLRGRADQGPSRPAAQEGGGASHEVGRPDAGRLRPAPVRACA